MKKFNCLILTTIILCLWTKSYAQESNSITGIIKAADDKAIEAATVSLLKAKDSSIVKISVTGKTGQFEFEKIKNDIYLFQVEAIGFDKTFSKTISISNAKRVYDAGEIKLSPATQSLTAVSVSAKRPLIETKIDKTVVNVDASPTNTGLTALELLEKSPGVTVDNDGNISLKGKAGVIILIDGKPTYLNGQDLSNYLKTLTANQLDQIEIMSQPSAKYDASGNSGVINFKTKKNMNNGFNGSVSSSAIFAVYFKNTNNLNLNWRKGKTNFFGNYGYTRWAGFNDINISRSLRASRDDDFNRYVQQHTYGKFNGRFNNFKAGMDYTVNEKTTVGVVVNGFAQNTSFTSSGTANIYDSLHNFVQYNAASSQTKGPWTNMGFNGNIQRKLDDKGSEISADADYIFYRTKGYQYSNNYLFNSDGKPAAEPFLLNGNIPSNIDIFTFKSDYTKPLKKGATLEAGIKTSFVKTDNDAQYTIFDPPTHKWVNDTTRSNHYVYKENINAAYINLQKQFKKFSFQLGLRAEQTISNGDQTAQSKDTVFKKNYTKLFPTVYVSYKLNENNTTSISYGKRIERPDYESLNPFQYQLDRYTYRQGNPNLQPQFSTNIEVSYNYKGQLNVSVNYTSITDIINDVIITERLPGDSNYTTYQTKQNIASNKNAGLSVSYNKKLVKWWTVNVFGNLYNNHYKGVIDDEPIDVSLASFSGNISNTFTFDKGWTGELSGFYNTSRYVSSAILAKPMGMFSLGAGKQILKTKGTVRINVRDPFYLMSFRGLSDLNEGVTQIKSVWDNRRLVITFNYRFGKTGQQQQTRRKSSGAADEQNRVSTGGGQQ